MTDQAEILYGGMSDSKVFERGWKKAEKNHVAMRYAFIFARIWKSNPDMAAYKVALNALHKCGIDVKANLTKDQKEDAKEDN